MILEAGTTWEIDDPNGATTRAGSIKRVQVLIRATTGSSVQVWLSAERRLAIPWRRFFVELNAEPVGLLRDTTDKAVKFAIREGRS